MKRFTVLLVIFLAFPAVIVAQDIFIPVDQPKATPSDWPTIINSIGHWVVEIVILVLAFLGQYRSGNATAKADEAVKKIEQGKQDDKVNIEHQTTKLENMTKDQTNQLLLAKIIEKPVVSAPTIPPVE